MTQRNVHSLVRAVAGWLSRNGVAGQPILVAFSGGPDSLALLRALEHLGQLRIADCGSRIETSQSAIRNPQSEIVHAAHLNHRLRGEESDGDQAFVEEYCRRRRIPLHVDQCDVAGVAHAAGANLEATARRLRYDWLGEVASRAGVRFIATGHTADDQAETLVHHLLRGTGLRGLRGIAARRPLLPDCGLRIADCGLKGPNQSELRNPKSEVELIRPLLSVSRDQVLDFLRAEELSARVDRSNFDLRLTRNRIRHELLPLLRSFNSEIVACLGRLAEQADALFREQEAAARRLLADTERPRAGEVIVLDADRVAQLAQLRIADCGLRIEGTQSAIPNPQSEMDSARNLVRELFYALWQREGWPVSEMTFAHWDRLAGLVFESRISDFELRIERNQSAIANPQSEMEQAHDFPGGVRVRRKRSVLQLRRRPKPEG